MTTLTNHAVSPRFTGSISPAYPVTLNDDNGVVNLTGCTSSSFRLTLWDMNNAANVIQASGSFTIVDAVNGKISYQWSTADLATAGAYSAYVNAKLPSEPGWRTFGPDIIIVSLLPLGAVPMATQDVNLLNVSGTAISASNPVPVAANNLGNATDASYSGAPGATTATSLIALLRALFDKTSQNAPVAGYVAAYASNAANTTGGSDYSFKWGASGTTQVNHILLQNNTAANIQYELDTAASVASPVLASGATILLDVPVSTLHLYSAANQNVNGTVASNIVVRGWM